MLLVGHLSRIIRYKQAFILHPISSSLSSLDDFNKVTSSSDGCTRGRFISVFMCVLAFLVLLKVRSH